MTSYLESLDAFIGNLKPDRVVFANKTDGSGTKYIAFRTVSNKSNPASWILNRWQATEDNMSKTLLKNLDRLINYRLQH